MLIMFRCPLLASCEHFFSSSGTHVPDVKNESLKFAIGSSDMVIDFQASFQSSI